MSRTFNGTTDKGVISSALLTSLGSGAQFYISAWGKSTSSTALQFLFAIGSTSSTAPVIGLAFDGTTAGDPIYALCRDNTPTGSVYFTTTGYTTNTWHHAALANYATNSRTVAIDNGSNVTNTSNASGAFSPTTTAVGVLKRTAESAFFAGKVARITIWRDASLANLPSFEERNNLAKGCNPLLVKNAYIAYHWDDDLADAVGSQPWTFTGTAIDSDNPPSSVAPIVANSVFSWEVPAGGSGSLGFTNTGLSYDSTNNELLIGDFTNTRIVRASQAGAYIGEIVLGGSPPASSVQGVAWDSSDGTYWVCHYAATNGTIRHYNSSGTLIDTFSPGIGNPGPNGCTYDAVSDRILAVWENGVVRGYDCADGSLDETVTLSLPAGRLADGLAIDPLDSSILWATVDQTTTDDFVEKFNRSTGALLWAYACPFDTENMAFFNNSIWLCCDQGFHSAVPNGNRVHKLDLTYESASRSLFRNQAVMRAAVI